MAHPYGGQDPITPNAPIIGKGAWVTVQVPDDGDDRDAASYGIGLEGVTDRTVWLAWRMVNGLESNSALTPYPADVWWSGSHTFAVGEIVTVNGVLSIPGSISGNVAIAGSLTVGTSLLVNGASNFKDPLLIEDTVIHSGDLAYEECRGKDGPDSGSSGTPTDVEWWKGDFWLATLATTNRVWRLPAPPAGTAGRVIFVTIRLSVAIGTITLELRNGAGVSIVTLGNGDPNAVTLAYYGTTFYVVSDRG